MALVVPFTPNPSAAGGATPQPPSTPFALMAMAQMHSEGRLVDPQTEPKADGKTSRPKRA